MLGSHIFDWNDQKITYQRTTYTALQYSNFHMKITIQIIRYFEISIYTLIMNKWGGHVSKNVATMDMSVHFSSLHTNTIVQSCSPPYLYIHKRQVKKPQSNDGGMAATSLLTQQQSNFCSFNLISDCQRKGKEEEGEEEVEGEIVEAVEA